MNLPSSLLLLLPLLACTEPTTPPDSTSTEGECLCTDENTRLSGVDGCMAADATGCDGWDQFLIENNLPTNAPVASGTELILADCLATLLCDATGINPSSISTASTK